MGVRGIRAAARFFPKLLELLFRLDHLLDLSERKAQVLLEAADDPDHPSFEDGYVDLTARYTVQPDYATCFFYYRDWGCGPGDVSVTASAISY